MNRIAAVNDSTETVYATRLYRGAITRLKEALAGDELAEGFLRAVLENTAESPEMPGHADSKFFVACFTELEDNSQQWFNYGGEHGENGYAIGFRASALSRSPRERRAREIIAESGPTLRSTSTRSSIATLLKDFVKGRKVGLLFSSRNGKPIASSNVTRRHLHPALKQLGFINSCTGTNKAGNHAFRRFRNTHLRNRTECPEGLQKFWMGHADQNMGDLYDKIKEDDSFRRMWAEKAGFGFELPSVVPNVPKTGKKGDVAEAA